MRDPRNRIPINRLYVLGAGASYSATQRVRGDVLIAPLDKDFTTRIADLDTSRPIWVSAAVERLVKTWIDQNDIRNLGLEAAIIRQLSHMRYFESIHPRRRSTIEPAELVDLIAHLITFILRRTRESTALAYRQLVSKIFPLGEFREGREENRIITFNYDDLIDKHLLARFSPERIYFDRIKRHSEQSDRRKNRYDDPLLVKLHGSVN